MAWTIKYTSTAKKQLSKLDKHVARRIIAYMDSRVVNDPLALGKTLKGDLGNIWCYRVGDTRILCDIQDNELVVLVIKLGHRKKVYD